MRLIADNNKKNYFDISIETSSEEVKNVSDCTLEFSIGLSRLINEYIHNWCKEKDDAVLLMDVILDTINTSVHDYFENGTFEEVTETREEHEIYAFMVDVFNHYLAANQKSEEDFLKSFQNFNTIKFVVVKTEDIISILLTNSDETLGVVLYTFRAELSKDDKELEKITGTGFIVATILGDKLFSEDKNPMRSLKCTPGFADGGLVKLIQDSMTD